MLGFDFIRLGKFMNRSRLSVSLLPGKFLFFLVLLVGIPFQTFAFTFSEKEIEQIRTLGPWPQSFVLDSSNRFSGKKEAIAFGRLLFETGDLSLNRDQGCSFCHQESNNFTDGWMKAEGMESLNRNTIGLLDVRLRHWYGWSGQSDTLWGASIRPIVDPKEMGMTSALVKERILESERFSKAYFAITREEASNHEPDIVLVNVGKALAAFQETLNSGPTAFDFFREGLLEKNVAAIEAYPKNAKRGLRLFLGKANCLRCHGGPNFALDEFHNIALPKGEGTVDLGRESGLQILKTNPWTMASSNSDEVTKGPDRTSPHETRRAFRVPSLRGLNETGPYMHDGRFETLLEAVSHYSDFDEADLPQTGERIMEPLGLTHRQIDQLVAFLLTLSN